MPWHGGLAHGGFSAARPWLPVPDSHRARAVDGQEDDRSSLLHAWRAQLRLRREHPALRHGALYQLTLPAPLIGFVRDDGREQVACLFNFSAEPVAVPYRGDGVPAVLPGYGAALHQVAQAELAEAAD
jgi:alpha-glucosidase